MIKNIITLYILLLFISNNQIIVSLSNSEIQLIIPDFRNKLNNNTFAVYENNYIRASESFVCLNPNAKIYGGFGNLIITFLGVQTLATTIGRIPLINHFLLKKMFSHPDNRQDWTILPINEVKKLEQLVRSCGSKCSDPGRLKFNNFPHRFGVNGCLGSYVEHKESIEYFENNLNISNYLPVNISRYDYTLNIISQWTLSNPTKIWMDIFKNYKSIVFGSISLGINDPSNFEVDVVVQFRSWRDLRDPNISYNYSKHLFENSCISHSSIHYVSSIQKKLNKKIIVFVTTDDIKVSSILVEEINNINPLLIQAVTGVDTKHGLDWHSGEAVQDFRYKDISDNDLKDRHELLDWMIMGDAKHALYSKSSTFAVTARLRKGIRHQLSDYYIVEEEKVENRSCSAAMGVYLSQSMLEDHYIERKLIIDHYKKIYASK